MLRGLGLGFLTVALVAACSTGPQAKVICEYHRSLPDGECRWAAHAVLDSVGDAHPAAVVVVVYAGGMGEIGRPFSRSAGPLLLPVTVFVRFSDGAPSIVRDLSDLSQKHPQVSEVLLPFDADDWINAAQKSNGTSVTSIASP